jgi:hypothetical protein
MPIQLHKEDGGKIIVVDLSGTLEKSDYSHLDSEFKALIEKHGKLRVLLNMTGFHGWEADALWSEF